MAAFAPPVRRGDFFYSSMLYANVGNGNHHPRATVSLIATLLRPEPHAQQSATSATDKVWHWYTAQLLHYGLPSTTNKNTAKVRLLDAISQCKLEVPAWILNMEAELKKEWQKETAKLKKGVKEVPKGIIKTKKEAPKGIIKRKQEAPRGIIKRKQEAPRGIIKRKQEAPKGIIKKKKDTKVSKISNNGVNVTVNLSLSSSLSVVQQRALMQSISIGKARPKTPARKKPEGAGSPSKRAASSAKPKKKT